MQVWDEKLLIPGLAMRRSIRGKEHLMLITTNESQAVTTLPDVVAQAGERFVDKI